jgi:hypothetical protein
MVSRDGELNSVNSTLPFSFEMCYTLYIDN